MCGIPPLRAGDVDTLRAETTAGPRPAGSVRLGPIRAPPHRTRGTMNTSARAAARAGLVGGAALLAAALTVTSAAAASAELDYSCEYFVGQTEDDRRRDRVLRLRHRRRASSSRWATRCRSTPSPVRSPFPTGFVEGLRDAEYSEIAGGGLMLTLLDETGEEYVVELSFDDDRRPGRGPDGARRQRSRATRSSRPRPAPTRSSPTPSSSSSTPARRATRWACSASSPTRATSRSTRSRPPPRPRRRRPSRRPPAPARVRPVVVQTDFAEDRSTRPPAPGRRRPGGRDGRGRGRRPLGAARDHSTTLRS